MKSEDLVYKSVTTVNNGNKGMHSMVNMDSNIIMIKLAKRPGLNYSSHRK